MVLGSVVWLVLAQACPAQVAAQKEATLQPDLKKLVRLDLGKGVMIDFVLIRPGTFTMGSDEGNNEKPVHKVTITKPFYLGKYLVTQEQWEAVMGNNPSNFKGPKNPVENVSWDDCQAFCAKLAASYRGTFRPPTEAQWEYACRAGSTGKYCFGDNETQLGEYAWYSDNSGQKTHPVGEKKSNAWGLYDMHGNVWEWCQDWYDNGYYAGSPADDPPGPATGSDRVGRGGSWYFPAGRCRSADRFGFGPGYRIIHLGFRVSRVLAE
jgi:formylglycine-generating enzyme required for sulfatase activity